jgi:hypothetical protein
LIAHHSTQPTYATGILRRTSTTKSSSHSAKVVEVYGNRRQEWE